LKRQKISKSHVIYHLETEKIIKVDLSRYSTSLRIGLIKVQFLEKGAFDLDDKTL